MILTREMARAAKAMIGPDESDGVHIGVCYSLDVVSNGKIDLDVKPREFWMAADRPNAPFKWDFTPKGDIKRRIFIDSLIGKDL